MKNLRKYYLALVLAIGLPEVVLGATNLVGNHVIVSNLGASEAGDLKVEGGIDYGLAHSSPTLAAVLLSYFPETKTATFDATDTNALFVWRDSVTASAAESKMILDGANVLSLFKSDGSTAGIVLDPNTGKVTLKGSVNGIYGASGNPLLTFTSGGEINFSGKAKFQSGAEFGEGGILNATNVSQLRGVLGKLGYSENPGEVTTVKQVSLSNNIGGVKIAGNGGYLYLTGFVNSGRATINGSLVSNNLQPTAFIAKCQPTGPIVWCKTFTATGALTTASITVDASGCAAVTGHFSGETNGLGSGKELSSSAMKPYAVKLENTGMPRWTRTWGDSGVEIPASAVDGSGNVVVAGTFSGSISDLGTGNNISSEGASDAFVLKLAASNGAVLWSKGFGGASDESFAAVTVDSSGNVICGGRVMSQPTTNLGPAYNVSSVGYINGFVVKLNSIGQISWASAIGDMDEAEFFAVTNDQAGNIFLGGTFSDAWYEGEGDPPFLVSSGGKDGMFVKMQANGSTEWAVPLGTLSDDQITALNIDSSGAVVAGGTMYQDDADACFVAKISHAGAIGVIQKIGRGSWGYLDGLTHVGNDNFVTGRHDGKFPVGDITTSSSWGNFVLGWSGELKTRNTESASFSWAGGSAGGIGSFAVGSEASAAGVMSTAFGSSNTTGTYGFSTGQSLASGVAASAFGYAEASGSSSAAFGASFAAGSNSASFGEGTVAGAIASFVVGQYNIGGGGMYESQIDPIFEVGNGNYNSGRSNAVSVLRNGKTTVTNKAWKQSEDPLGISSDPQWSSSEAFVVEGHTRLKGRVVIEQPQGDISMGIYE